MNIILSTSKLIDTKKTQDCIYRNFSYTNILECKYSIRKIKKYFQFQLNYAEMIKLILFNIFIQKTKNM